MAKEKKEDKSKISELEKRIEELEEKEKPEGSIVGNTLNSLIPGFGKFISKLSKNSPELRKRLEETDKEVQFRLKSGGSAKPHIEYHFSTRPLFAEKPPAKRGGIVKEEDIKSIVVWEETPSVEESELKVYASGRNLIIETKDGKYHKEIPLKCFVKDIEIKYNKEKDRGILVAKMQKR